MSSIAPNQVHDVLRRSMLVDGMPLVFDSEKSCGPMLHDARSGEDYLDLFGFFASQPVGFNHPHLTDPEWLSYFGRWALNNPSNSDVYTVPMAHFVATFGEVAQPAEMKHLFLVAGGALAVENALKTAFDWKARRNQQQGKSGSADQVIHLKHAFHGRSGYTLSLTNTDPAKTDLFPKFDWPRVPSPYCEFPLEGANLEATQLREQECLTAIRGILEERATDVAALIIEPIQCEGGDLHIRKEAMLEMRRLADEHDVLFIFDEVQTGLGLTGKMWCYQNFDVIPDIVAFGKKVQVCGIMATDRIDEVKGNVFETSSRINSTWGGNLVDMMRSQRTLEIYRDGSLLKNVNARGEQLLAGLRQLQEEFPDKLSNARGRGLLCAADLTSGAQRGALLDACYERKVLALACGDRSVRFRPVLDIDAASIERGLSVLKESMATL